MSWINLFTLIYEKKNLNSDGKKSLKIAKG